jgi:hypothetical protein
MVNEIIKVKEFVIGKRVACSFMTWRERSALGALSALPHSLSHSTITFKLYNSENT